MSKFWRNLCVCLMLLCFAPQVSAIMANDNEARSYDPQVNILQLRPTNVTPDGDGINDTLNISFSLFTREKVELVIENDAGIVAEILKGEWLDEGNHKFVWNVKNTDGKIAPKGKYRVKLVLIYQNSLTYTRECEVKSVDRLKLTVNKNINLNYIWVTGNADAFKAYQRLKPGITLQQSLKVEMEGRFLNRFYLYGTFDDQSIEVKKNFILGYKGDFLDLYLGNHNLLTVPNDLFAFSQKVWGLRAERKNAFKFLYGQIEGMQETEEIAGKGYSAPYSLSHDNILYESEKVYVDDVLLVRGETYQIDYSTGEIVFTEVIPSVAKIKITYEYYPGYIAQIVPRWFITGEYELNSKLVKWNTSTMAWYDVKVENKDPEADAPILQKQGVWLNKLEFTPWAPVKVKQELGLQIHDKGTGEVVNGVGSQTNISFKSKNQQVGLDLRWEEQDFYFLKPATTEDKWAYLNYTGFFPGGVKLEAGIKHTLDKEKWEDSLRLKGAVKKGMVQAYDLETTFSTKDDLLWVNGHYFQKIGGFYFDVLAKNKWYYADNVLQYESTGLSNRIRYNINQGQDISVSTYNYLSKKGEYEERYTLNASLNPFERLTFNGSGQWIESEVRNSLKQYTADAELKYVFPKDFTASVRGKYSQQVLAEIRSSEIEAAFNLEKSAYSFQLAYLQNTGKLAGDEKEGRLSLKFPAYKGLTITPGVKYNFQQDKWVLEAKGVYLVKGVHQVNFGYEHKWQKTIQEDALTTSTSIEIVENLNLDFSHNLFHRIDAANPEENYWGGMLRIGGSIVF